MTTQMLKNKSFLSLAVYGARPKTLIAALFPVVLGMLLARSEGKYDIILYLSTLLCACFIQIGTNYANDYFDDRAGRDTKHRIGPPRLGALGLISKKALFSLVVFAFAAACFFAIPIIITGGALIAYLLVLAVALGIFYTYGNYSLANTGLANTVIFVVFGPLATVISYYLQTGAFETKVAFYGILPGCLSIMMFAMNNLRDYTQDKASGKKTLVVRFGFKWGVREYLTALFLSWLIVPATIILYNAPLVTLFPLVLLPKGIALAKKVAGAKSPKDIVPLFELTAKYNALFALSYIISWRLTTVI